MSTSSTSAATGGSSAYEQAVFQKLEALSRTNGGQPVSMTLMHQGASDEEKGEIVNAVNGLLKLGRIELMRDGSEVLLRPINEDEAKKLLGLTTIEQMMLQSVVQSGGNGIWSRDLRRKCGLQQAQFAKFLKNLEARKLIKSFKPVTAKNRKHYLAYNTEPSSELTGGPWYNDSGAFDEQYVTTMRDTLLQFLRYSKEPQTVGQLMKLVDKSEVSSVRIDASQILLLCHRLVAEGNALEEPARGSSACVDNSARGTPIDTNERRFRAVATPFSSAPNLAGTNMAPW